MSLPNDPSYGCCLQIRPFGKQFGRAKVFEEMQTRPLKLPKQFPHPLCDIKNLLVSHHQDMLFLYFSCCYFLLDNHIIRTH